MLVTNKSKIYSKEDNLSLFLEDIRADLEETIQGYEWVFIAAFLMNGGKIQTSVDEVFKRYPHLETTNRITLEEEY